MLHSILFVATHITGPYDYTCTWYVANELQFDVGTRQFGTFSTQNRSKKSNHRALILLILCFNKRAWNWHQFYSQHQSKWLKIEENKNPSQIKGSKYEAATSNSKWQNNWNLALISYAFMNIQSVFGINNWNNCFAICLWHT